jgi:hypothetical protein
MSTMFYNLAFVQDDLVEFLEAFVLALYVLGYNENQSSLIKAKLVYINLVYRGPNDHSCQH